MIKRSMGLAFFVSLCFLGFSQDKTAIKYSKLITSETAKAHLGILASDEFEGRETGKPGAEKAAKYLAGELEKLRVKAPVKGSFYQIVPLQHLKVEADSFVVNGRKLQHLSDFYVNKTAEYRSFKASEIVFAGYGISSEMYDDFANIEVKDKVVLIYNNEEPARNGISLISGSSAKSDWTRYRDKRINYLKSKGPSLILTVNPFLSEMLGSLKRHSAEDILQLKKDGSQGHFTDVPVVAITPETANVFLNSTGKTLNDLIARINNSGKPASQKLNVEFRAAFGTTRKDVNAKNVLGYLEGSDLKDELVVISAHYDHVGLSSAGPDTVFNGADDDGSGTTAVLELARAFSKAKKDGKGPRRSILFLFNVGEEKGLLGSEWYSDNPVFPLENTVANLNIDMIGRIDPAHKADTNYCYLIGSDKLSTELHRISENANATYTKMKIDYKYNDPKDPERIYYRSDHYNFAKHNIPIIFYFNGIHEDYHKESDEVSKINFPLLVKRAQLVFFTAWDLLNRATRPLVDVKAE